MKEQVEPELLRSMLQDLKSVLNSVQSSIARLEEFIPDEFPEVEPETLTESPECNGCKVLKEAAFEYIKQVGELESELAHLKRRQRNPNNFPEITVEPTVWSEVAEVTAMESVQVDIYLRASDEGDNGDPDPAKLSHSYTFRMGRGAIKEIGRVKITENRWSESRGSYQVVKLYGKDEDLTKALKKGI